jgi:hypothetical protein
MLKLVTEKIRKIIKNHVSLNSKIIEIHWKNNGFWWFRRLHVRVVKVSKKHQKGDQNPSEIQWQIDQQIMFFLSSFSDLLFLMFLWFVSKMVVLGTNFEIRWGQKSAPGRRKDPAERVCTVFASRCFPILHCTIPHITFSFVISLGKCICRSPCDSRRAKRGVLGAADFQMSSKIDHFWNKS